LFLKILFCGAENFRKMCRNTFVPELWSGLDHGEVSGSKANEMFSGGHN